MIGRDSREPERRGEMLVTLNHGLRQALRLADQLCDDAIVGNEARGLLGRLQAIRAELDALSTTLVDPRRAENDPFWREPPFPFRAGNSNQAGR